MSGFTNLGDEMVAEILDAAMNKLAKWRSFFVSWQLGTRPQTDGECRAIKNHREATIVMRAELNALTALMIAKGVFTSREFTEQLIEEARALDAGYEAQYPGFSTSADGLHMQMPAAAETVKKLGFPA